MKKFINAGLLSIALLASLVANASKKVNVTVSSSKQLSISLTEVSQGEVLSISNKNNEVIFSDILNVADSFTENIDFSNFKQGVYYIQLKTENTIKVTPIIVSTKLSKIIEGETKIYNTPKVSIVNEMLNITLNNEGNNEVSIIIYEKGSSNALEEIKTSKTEINKIYQSGLMPNTDYEVYISQGDYNSTKTTVNL